MTATDRLLAAAAELRVAHEAVQREALRTNRLHLFVGKEDDDPKVQTPPGQ
jgi:hypothetical protein